MKRINLKCYIKQKFITIISIKTYMHVLVFL